MKKLLLISILLTSIIQANELTAETCVDSTKQAEELFFVKKKITQKEFNKIVGPLCDKGCGRACTKLDGSLGSPASKKKGCNAKIPHSWACYDLSFNEENKEKKFKLLQKSCVSGYVMGCGLLARKYANDKNYGYALKYRKMGCDLEDDESCGTLGMIYATGEYGETSPEKAYKFWNKSVKLNPNNNISKDNLKILCKNHPSVCK